MPAEQGTAVPKAPYFSVVITTYNRSRIVRRCLESCLRQTMDDFEVIVVDDASTDDTAGSLAKYDDPRLRVLVHDSNRGINPARHTGAENARGEWVVVLDSDWELFPQSLTRLREIIDGLPAGVRVVRSRLLWDDGTITPRFMPRGPIGYEGRIRWVEAEGGYDAGRCIARAVFEETPYFADRRGAMETLFELELASRETTLCVDDVLGMEHSDAPNSWLRTTDSKELVPRLFAEAPDMLWMAETSLERHGDALRRLGPRQYRTLSRVAAVQAFLIGRRRKGLGHVLAALRAWPLDAMAWAVLALGLIGPGAVAHGTVAFRRLGAVRA